MPTLRLAVAFALAALLALPLASAAEGSGTLEATKALLPGASSFASSGVAFRWEGEGSPVLTLRAESVDVRRIGETHNRFVTASAPVSERASFGASTLTLTATPGSSLAAFDATGAATGTLADATARPVQGSILATVGTWADCRPDDWPWCLGVEGVTEVASDHGELTLSGDVRMILRGPTLEIDHAGGTASYTSGERSTSTETQSTWVILTLKGVTGTVAADDAAWYAPTPTIHAAEASFTGATGRLDVGLQAYQAQRETLDLGGALTLAFGKVARAPAPDPSGPLYADSAPVAVSGDLATVSLRAMPLYASSPTATAGVAALVAVAATGLAYAWHHLAFHAAALYTRLRQPQLLDNDVRNRIYEIIRTNPGISARAVHRMSEQSWGTVVYHLRQLERHHLVVSRSVGRTRNYYENHGKYRGMEVQLACLQSPRARTLARLVLASPGVTQEELVERSGYPQPTASYYVRKLKEATLVEERREGRYARYHPVGDVGRFLDLADAGSAAAAPAEPGPAQA